MRTPAVVLPLLTMLTLHASDKPVPVVDEPFHKTVFENEIVRVIDVQMKPGETSLYHIHVIPSVIIYLTQSTNRSESWPKKEMLTREISPGQSRYAPYDKQPLTHRVTNTGSGLFRVFDIELLNRPTSDAKLPPLTSPQVKLHWEEKLARSSGIHLDAGARVTIPANRAAAMVVPIKGTVDVRAGATPKGPAMKWGEYRVFPANTPLEIVNSGGDQAEAVLLELKL